MWCIEIDRFCYINTKNPIAYRRITTSNYCLSLEKFNEIQLISFIAIHEHNVLESMILFLDSVAFNCSAFTMITIALERYLVLCMNK